MKRLMLVIIGALLVVGFCYEIASGDSVNSNVPLTFTVQDEFGFTLDKNSYDFGSIATGTGTETTIGIFCKSNHGREWYLGIQAPEFSNGAGGTLASDPGFVVAAWNGDEGGPGNAGGTFLYTGAVPSAMMYDFYASTLAEGTDPYTVVTLGLYITVPAGQAAGLYQTTMTLTMHD